MDTNVEPLESAPITLEKKRSPTSFLLTPEAYEAMQKVPRGTRSALVSEFFVKFVNRTQPEPVKI